MDGESVAAIINPPWSLHDLLAAGYLGMESILEKAFEFSKLDWALPTIQSAARTDRHQHVMHW